MTLAETEIEGIKRMIKVLNRAVDGTGYKPPGAGQRAKDKEKIKELEIKLSKLENKINEQH